MKKENISRRGLLLGMLATAGSAAISRPAQAFDFLGNGQNSDGGTGLQTVAPRNNGGYNSQRAQPSSCESRAAAMNQRTGSSRPIEQVRYYGDAPVGSIEVSISDATLYHISSQGVATAYPIGAGDDSHSLVGKNIVIGRKTAWPTWTPTANIARRLGISQTTQPGGPCNPLGAFAMYLYEYGRDTIFRIHGTNDPKTIGCPNVSSGCIRMYNEDVTYLQQFIGNGAQVRTYSGAVPGIASRPRQVCHLNR